MISQWDLLENFSEDFPERWKVVLHSEREDVLRLTNILIRLNFSCGRPTSSREKNFNWSFYVYQLNAEETRELRNIIEEFKETAEEFPVEKYMRAKGTLGTGETPSPSREEHEEKVSKKEEDITEEEKSILISQIGLNPRYSFESFVVGKNNHFAKAAALAVAEMPGKVYNPLFVYGDVGLGKTHLMQAIGHYIISVNPKAKVIYTSAERFMAEVIDAIRYGKIVEFRNKYRKMDALLIDDIQFLSEAEAAQEEFYHTFNALYDDHKQIVIASDKPPKKISVLEERLRSRFEWGLITDIQLPNLETRVAILKAKADLTNIDIGDEVLYFIAEQLKSNIRELEGFLIRIVAYASLTKRQINKGLAEELLHDLLPEDTDTFETSTIPLMDEVFQELEIAEEEKPETAEAVAKAEESSLEGDSEQQSTETASPTEVVVEGVSQPPIEIQYEKETVSFAKEEFPSSEKTEEEKELSLSTAESSLSETSVAEPPVEKAQSPVPEEPTPAPPAPEVIETIEPKKTEDKLNSIRTIYFYPAGKLNELNIMQKNFEDIIKKHKIKFALDGVCAQEYAVDSSLDFSMLLSECRAHNGELVIWMGPPPYEGFVEAEFVRTIHSAFDREKIPLQYIPFDSIPKQYKYLNMVLDFAFLKKK